MASPTAATELTELAELVIEASLHWTGEDEERNPRLKRLRTLAGLALGERTLAEQGTWNAIDSWWGA